MGSPQIGQYVDAVCEAFPGTFPDEYVVILETPDEKVSGFVPKKYIFQHPDAHQGQWLIKGIVRDIKENTITVQFPGSYFTTAMGLIDYPIDWWKEPEALNPSR